MQTLRSGPFLTTVVLFAALTATAGIAHAGIVQSTADLPPSSGAYVAGTICINIGPGICVVHPSLFGFTGTTTVINSMGEAIDSNISFSAAIYSNHDDHPGVFLGNLAMAGPIGILYANRTSETELGTFTSTLTELDMTGTFNGHSLEVMLATMPSSGPTTVMQFGQDFRVTSFFDVFAEVSLDHGGFMPGPKRTFVLTPEPGTAVLLTLGLLGTVNGRFRKKAKQS